MFIVPRFSIRVLMLLPAYTAVLLPFAGGHYLATDCTIVGVWLVPVALAAFIRPRWLLAITCASLNLVLYAVARTIVFATARQPGFETVNDVSGSFFLGAFYPAAAIFNHGYCPVLRDDIVRIVIAAAALYALIGVAFSYAFSPREPHFPSGNSEAGEDLA